ncbi:MAG: glycosyltransferase family 4 protein, partial [Clostridia bacterium]|nr:glycosyltransferase family 4 protein [Clostridia bacterium]
VKTRSDDEYLTIFASDTLIPSVKVKNSIAIQHGIFWDIPKDRNESLFRSFLSKSVSAYKIVKRISNSETVVCVDNNFINWFRTQIWQRDVNLIPIMNFTEIPKEEIIKEEDRINIVFARRFVEYRGTRIFASAIKRILEKYNNVYVTFAGEGPDEEFLSRMFKNDERVNITKYSSDESIEFHSKYHIAAVPTVGSEGTSLSLLEAMAAGCTVICSNVGGMTNIILDGYNGLMVNPDENSFYEGICELIDNNELREEIANNGKKTVEKAFSLDRWNKKWKTTILNGFKKEQ